MGWNCAAAVRTRNILTRNHGSPCFHRAIARWKAVLDCSVAGRLQYFGTLAFERRRRDGTAGENGPQPRRGLGRPAASVGNLAFDVRGTPTSEYFTNSLRRPQIVDGAGCKTRSAI